MSRTFVSFVLDESGSMAICRDAAISGFNEYVGDLRKESDIVLTLTKFNTESTIVYVGKPITDVPDLTHDTYRPSGNTALLDAVADTIHAVDQQATWGDRILVVILTDGEENSSHRHTVQDVRRLIEQKQGEGNWTFAYVGSVQDPWKVAGEMGIAGGNTVAYVATPAGTQSAAQQISSSTAAYARSSRKSTSSFFKP